MDGGVGDVVSMDDKNDDVAQGLEDVYYPGCPPSLTPPTVGASSLQQNFHSTRLMHPNFVRPGMYTHAVTSEQPVAGGGGIEAGQPPQKRRKHSDEYGPGKMRSVFAHRHTTTMFNSTSQHDRKMRSDFLKDEVRKDTRVKRTFAHGLVVQYRVGAELVSTARKRS